MNLFRKQFLLTSKDNFDLNWPEESIEDFTLYHHPELNLDYRKDKNHSIYLLGLIFAWWQPEFNNHEIVDYLFNAKSLDELIQLEAPCMGEYTIIYKNQEELYIFNDASSLSEIYYDEDFTTFGTQPKLISRCVATRKHSKADAVEFYTSKQFTDNRIFIGNTTHYENIFHLMCNHCINIEEKKVKRFFPVKKITRRPLKQVSKMVAERLKGYLKSISLKGEMAMPVTGGLDSRILFLASLELDCDYFIIKTKQMDDNHHDIIIPQQLTKIFNKPFRVIPVKYEIQPEIQIDYNNSIDFPRLPTLGIDMKDTNNVFYINGNVSEIARNYFGDNKNLNGEDLNYLNLFGDRYNLQVYPNRVYEKWLHENRKYFKNLGYHYLDMFFWDEKGCNSCGKAYSEEKALGFINVTPYNSRELLNLMLSVKRKYRDRYHNKLYNAIIKELTDKWKQVFEVPTNPVVGQKKIRKLKKIKIYKLYSYYKLKRRKLII